jgi:hypothetical protein
MKIRIIALLATLLTVTGCVTVPKETITLSQTLGNDLKVLHTAHLNIVNIHFVKIKEDINSFVDEVYAPYVIQFVLKSELANYKTGKPSLYGTIESTKQQEGTTASNNALNEMLDFQTAARKQIESKRDELLSPILKQEAEITQAINQSYENAIYANSTITAYLQSIRKVKDAQQEALAIIDLKGADTLMTNSLVNLSEQVSKAVKAGKEIDIQGADAYNKLSEITDKIKEITSKK